MLETGGIETEFGIDFDSYFAAELKQLKLMAQDGLIRVGDHRLDVTARGRLLIRNVCKVFDHYRVEQEEKFSKMI
jgi:oxygen-independent coproporphyrinogen-3 oxidase